MAAKHPTSGAHTDFTNAMSYGDYLHLDTLLAAQEPRSGKHDEMLFIIIHQSSELWMKLILQELAAASAEIRADHLRPAFKMLARVSGIQNQLIQSWDVLSTMTPADYLTFRDDLGQSSGFQFHQYRAIEFILGNKNPDFLKPFVHHPDLHDGLRSVLEAPSVYDVALALLAKRGLPVPADRLKRDWRQPYAASKGVRSVWQTVYSDTGVYWDLYELAKKLVDLEDRFQQWRFRHLTTVARIIGAKRGTGGTAGVDYLRKALEIRLFPELWQVRTAL